MPPVQAHVLALNGGSSSIKFAFYRLQTPLERTLSGRIDRIGLGGANLSFRDVSGTRRGSLPVSAPDAQSAVATLTEWLVAQEEFPTIRALGHRVVHGMEHVQPERVSQDLIDELRRITPYAPEHLPIEIELMEAFRRNHPELPQVACFDTAFHQSMPRVARLLPIPRRFDARGVRRYGFHGLSYAYLMEELARVAGARAAEGRVILAHLGNGASMAAVKDGKCIDTSMGFTPTAGLPMSTRSGDLDPGLVSYLAREEHVSTEQFSRMVSRESGLLGVSETSSDLRDLLAREHEDARAAEAVAMFCYHARKWIGSFSAVLGGLDTLVFSAGVGENQPVVRGRICEGFGFLGLELNATRNLEGAALISSDASRVAVRVLRTDEELMIARSASRLLGC